MEAPLHKVGMIVTRTGLAGPELLVFEHDRSGVQIPAGSVEPHEDVLAAALRELREEAGLVVDRLELLTSFRNDSKPDERYCVEYVPLLDSPSNDGRVLIEHVYRLPLRLYAERDGWAEVALVEWDLEADPPTEIGSVRGFVRSSALATWEMRHLFWSAAPPGTPDAWEQLDEGDRVYRLRWAPLDDAGLLSWQQNWLDRVREQLSALLGDA
jgi:8-oxo-dGTP pyrophosphatase MutT (NUDIX family)